eukprot:3479380-Rhodomonas_salina.8
MVVEYIPAPTSPWSTRSGQMVAFPRLRVCRIVPKPNGGRDTFRAAIKKSNPQRMPGYRAAGTLVGSLAVALALGS